MSYTMKCTECGNVSSIRGYYEPDTNVYVFPDDDDMCVECGSTDLDIIGEESDDYS